MNEPTEPKKYVVTFPHVREFNGQDVMFEPGSGVHTLPDDDDTRQCVEKGWLKPFEPSPQNTLAPCPIKDEGEETTDLGKQEPDVSAGSASKQKELALIGDRLRTQDNRCTSNPMFCVQIKRRDVGYDSAYIDRRCWHDSAGEQTIYDDDADFQEPPKGNEWDEFGYVDRWETVMVAFTEGGCEEYLRLNGHNDRSLAHNGEVRIYVKSWNRCPEMIAVREWLLEAPSVSDGGSSPATSVSSQTSPAASTATTGTGPMELLETILRVARGCFDYGGGYRSDDGKLEIYHHGVQTVVNALEGFAARGMKDTQIAVLYRMGAPSVGRATDEQGADQVLIKQACDRPDLYKKLSASPASTQGETKKKSYRILNHLGRDVGNVTTDGDPISAYASDREIRCTQKLRDAGYTAELLSPVLPLPLFEETKGQ